MVNVKLYPLCAALSGAALALAFPPAGLAFLSWAGLAPLIVVSCKSSPRQAFFLGCLTGTVWTAGMLYWTYVYHPLAVFPVVAVLSLYTGLFSISINLISKKFTEKFLVFSVPVAWTALEYVKSLGILGFPWNTLGYSQHLNLPLLQIAQYTGVFGVSFIVLTVNGGIAAALIERKNLKNSLVYASAPLLLPLFFTINGAITMRGYIPPEKGKINITAVQPSIHPEIKWSEFGPVIAQSFVSLSREIKSQDSFITIFPETASAESLGRAFSYRTWLYDSFKEISEIRGGYILTGAHFIRDGKLYNSAYLISPDGEIAGRYDKIKLVPAGEYAPYVNRMKIFSNIFRGAGSYTPGRERTVFKEEGHSFSVLICFEGIFGDHARRFVREGAGFLVNITNDAWSMSRTSHYQHAAMTTLRSIENRVYTVRVGNTGISKVVNPAGETEIELPYWTRGYFTHRITPRPAAKTFYTLHGDVFAQTSGFLFIILVLSSVKKKTNASSRTPCPSSSSSRTRRT